MPHPETEAAVRLAPWCRDLDHATFLIEHAPWFVELAGLAPTGTGDRVALAESLRQAGHPTVSESDVAAGLAWLEASALPQEVVSRLRQGPASSGA